MSVDVLFLLYKIAARDLQVGAIAELTCWCITVYWTIVVRHTVGFKEALRHSLWLSLNTNISHHMVCKYLIVGFGLESNDSAIVGESYQRIHRQGLFIDYYIV